MKDLIRQMKALKVDSKIQNEADDNYNLGIDRAIKILQSHPVIHAKALRWKYTGEWCYLNEKGLWEGRPYPDIASSLANEPPECSELVDLIILEQ